jgi:hypothetical protein
MFLCIGCRRVSTSDNGTFTQRNSNLIEPLIRGVGCRFKYLLRCDKLSTAHNFRRLRWPTSKRFNPVCMLLRRRRPRHWSVLIVYCACTAARCLAFPAAAISRLHSLSSQRQLSARMTIELQSDASFQTDVLTKLYSNIVSMSPVETVTIRGRKILVKRDDKMRLAESGICGNKARKLYAMNAIPAADFPELTVSHGGSQSNAMLALAAVCSSKGKAFRYYTKVSNACTIFIC